MDSMINGMLIVWYILTAGSLLFITWDLFANTPTLGVMKAARILIILYTGPVDLFNLSRCAVMIHPISITLQGGVPDP